MATVTAAISAVNTGNNAALTTASFTPVANDLLVVFAVVTGQAAGGTFTDSQGLGFDAVLSVLKNTSADTLVVAVARKPAAASAMTVTFTPAGAPTASGVAIGVLRVAGLTRTGGDAVRQVAGQANQAGSTAPAPVFGAACLTGNPVLGAVANGANPAGLTPTASPAFAEAFDTGYATPTTGLEIQSVNSGFTGGTLTWGSATTVYCAGAVELDVSAAVYEPGFAAHSARVPDVAAVLPI